MYIICMCVCVYTHIWIHICVCIYICVCVSMYMCVFLCICVYPMWLSGKESTCHCRRPMRYEFHLWIGKIPWRRKWQSTPVFLLGKSHGQGSLVGYSPWHPKRIGHDLVTKIMGSKSKDSEQGLWSQAAWVWILTQHPHFTCVALDKLLSPSEPQYLQLYDGDDNYLDVGCCRN